MFKPFRGREGGNDKTLLISGSKADDEPTTMRKPPAPAGPPGADSAPRSPPVESGQRARQPRMPGKDEATMLRPNVKFSRGDEHTMLRPSPQPLGKPATLPEPAKPGIPTGIATGPGPSGPAPGGMVKKRPLDATIAMTDGLIVPAPGGGTAPLSPVQGGPRPGGPPGVGPGAAPVPASVLAARTGTATPVAVARPGAPMGPPKGAVGPLVAGGAAAALALAAIAFFIVRSHVKAEAAFHDPAAGSATSSTGALTPLTLDMPTATDQGSLPPLSPPSAGTRQVVRWNPNQQAQPPQPPPPPATVTAAGNNPPPPATTTVAQNQPQPPASSSAAPGGSVDPDAKHLTDEADKELLDLLNRSR